MCCETRMIACGTCGKCMCVTCLRKMSDSTCPYCMAFHQDAYMLKRARWAKKILLYYGADVQKFVGERGEKCKIETDGGSLLLDDLIDCLMRREGRRVYKHTRGGIHQYI